MRAIAAVLTALSLLAVACGNPENSPDVGTPTPEAPAFRVLGPRPQSEALAQGEWSYFSALVLDVAAGEVFTINRTTPTANGPYTGPIQWWSDTTLVTYDGYAIELGGGITSEPGPIATTTPGLMPDVTESADALWSAERNLAIAGITLTEQATGRRFDLPDTDKYQWAPAGHLMATGGGWCGGGPVSIVAPDDDSVTQVALSGRGVVYVWQPDGKALALDLLHQQPSLVLVDALTGNMTTLIAPAEYVGEFVPLEWNPSGTHLLFRIHGGRDCSN